MRKPGTEVSGKIGKGEPSPARERHSDHRPLAGIPLIGLTDIEMRNSLAASSREL